MIISISGELGSGKSTVSKMLAKKLNFNHYSTGDLCRTMATKHNLDIYEYNKLAEIDKSIDQKIDEYSVELGKKEDNFIIDSRLAWYFIPRSFKIRLTVNGEEGAKRIFEHSKKTGRDSEKIYKNIQATAEANKKRVSSENQRYIETYNVNITNPNNYDLIIDTTNISPEEVMEEIMTYLPKDK